MSVEFSRLFTAPALIWDGKGWIKTDETVKQVLFNLMWNLLSSKHPELAVKYADYKMSFDPKTQCIVLELVKEKKVSGTRKSADEDHGVMVVEVGRPA